jgi:hypothetical protein
MTDLAFPAVCLGITIVRSAESEPAGASGDLSHRETNLYNRTNSLVVAANPLEILFRTDARSRRDKTSKHKGGWDEQQPG